MTETTRRRRNKWDITSEPQNPIEHDDGPLLKSDHSAEDDTYPPGMESYLMTLNSGNLGLDNDTAMMESTCTLSLPSKMETDPIVVSSAKIETDKFVEYSQMKDEDFDLLPNDKSQCHMYSVNAGDRDSLRHSDFVEGKTDNINMKRERSEISPKKHHNGRTLSPEHDPRRQKSPAMSSKRSRSRSKSWSRSRSRSRGRGRGRSRSQSRSPVNGHRRRSLRSRSRSRSPYYRSRREPDDSMERDRMIMTCRDFAFGRCRRGIDCRFIHDDSGRRPYDPCHDVDERKVEKENARVSREPIENTYRDERGYQRYSGEPVEKTRRNERGSLRNSREPTESNRRNERENYQDLREPIDNTPRKGRDNFRDSRESIDYTHRNEREKFHDSREPIDNMPRNERENLGDSREPTEIKRRKERDGILDSRDRLTRNSREPTEIKHRNERDGILDSRDRLPRNERENLGDSGEPTENARKNERENLGDSRESADYTRRNERDDIQGSRDRSTRNDYRPPVERDDIRDPRDRSTRNDSRPPVERDDIRDSRDRLTRNDSRPPLERDDIRDSRDGLTRNDNRPPVACYDFSRGRCQRGSECRYAHHDSSFDYGRSYSSRDEYRTRTQRVVRDTVCKFYADGCCRRGQSCSFSHVILGPRDGDNGPRVLDNRQSQSKVDENNMHQNQQLNQNQTQSQQQHPAQNQNQNQPQNMNINQYQNQNQPQNAINPLPLNIVPLQTPNIQMPQLVQPLPIDEQMQQAVLSIIQNGQNQFVPQPNSNFNMPIQNLPVLPPLNFNMLPPNAVGQQIQPPLPFPAPNFCGPALQNIPQSDNVTPNQPPNPEIQAITSEIQSSQMSNDITQKVVTSEQAAQITSISASLAHFLKNAGGALNPQIAAVSGSAVPPNQDPATDTEANKITETEVQKRVKEIGTVDNKKEDEEGSKQTKDGKGTKMFKCAIVDFVKDSLKPNWKEGQLSREAHKTIVKKVVDKVTGAMQSHNIPQTQEKIDIYMSHSKPKLAKLVQAYVEKYVKG